MSSSPIPEYEAILQQRLPAAFMAELRAPVIEPLAYAPWQTADVSVDVLPCDRVHPVISGNKWYKLKFNLVAAWQQDCNTLASFGGAWSNHLHALAYCANRLGMNSIGYVRGDELDADANPMLRDAQAWGMELRFLTREQYRNKQVALDATTWLIPEGGDNEWGVLGCTTLLTPEQAAAYDVVVLPWGTGCTCIGVWRAVTHVTRLWGVSVLKGDWPARQFADYRHAHPQPDSRPAEILTTYHCGGYGRTTAELLSFIRKFGDNTGLSLDPVYSGKALFALDERIRKQALPAGSRVLFIHTGGLQGVRGFQSLTG
ncbi:MAG: pyridoxal-phosphate dependent enzyme [Gammaproteobacteria bacterium]